MKIRNPFRFLNKFELGLWISSVIVVTVSYLCSPPYDVLSIITSLIGVTALIFVAKGLVVGQALCIIFALFYAIISYKLQYYGEMITYLGLSAPAALASVISWLKNPFKDTNVVEVGRVRGKNVAVLIILTVTVTVGSYLLLKLLGTSSLVFSTISVTTSVTASYLTFIRSPFYAIGYALNDVVLIVLWVIAAVGSITYLPMVFCFVMFLLNDLYGFVSWKRIETEQKKEKASA